MDSYLPFHKARPCANSKNKLVDNYSFIDKLHFKGYPCLIYIYTCTCIRP